MDPPSTGLHQDVEFSSCASDLPLQRTILVEMVMTKFLPHRDSMCIVNTESPCLEAGPGHKFLLKRAGACLVPSVPNPSRPGTCWQDEGRLAARYVMAAARMTSRILTQVRNPLSMATWHVGQPPRHSPPESLWWMGVGGAFAFDPSGKSVTAS